MNLKEGMVLYFVRKDRTFNTLKRVATVRGNSLIVCGYRNGEHRFRMTIHKHEFGIWYARIQADGYQLEGTQQTQSSTVVKLTLKE